MVNNFNKFLMIKQTLKLNGTYETIGELGVYIRVGGYRDGLCIDYTHMYINKQVNIDQIINDYKPAKDRAAQIQHFRIGVW